LKTIALVGITFKGVNAEKLEIIMIRIVSKNKEQQQMDTNVEINSVNSTLLSLLI